MASYRRKDDRKLGITDTIDLIRNLLGKYVEAGGKMNPTPFGVVKSDDMISLVIVDNKFISPELRDRWMTDLGYRRCDS